MDETQKKTTNSLSEVYDWIQSILFALVFCVLLFVFVVRLVDVVGTSMVPTLQDSDKMVVSNLFYNPKQGDIIILNPTLRNLHNTESILTARRLFRPDVYLSWETTGIILRIAVIPASAWWTNA